MVGKMAALVTEIRQALIFEANPTILPIIQPDLPTST